MTIDGTYTRRITSTWDFPFQSTDDRQQKDQAQDLSPKNKMIILVINGKEYPISETE
eukprot:CAMPEP_0178941674 /NCGR_PEP_ID=MMETSP0789-20121207/1542_1 /TAXON_ID=3005 /ORGANISM="Rhizosolenia setigera, Strain CCMP 1694" /LENGTH=56 /DNA_ID=CAMNT_0020620943 /DNA_START=445 /DNA_END=615 /DNA_ORIENTATION=-